MKNKEINSPSDLAEELIRIFPEFKEEWDEGEGFGYDGNYNYHTVFLTFGPESRRLLNAATPERIKEFANLINELVRMGGVYENAASTCFLEHASQLHVRKLIQPLLSAEAKRELR